MAVIKSKRCNPFYAYHFLSSQQTSYQFRMISAGSTRTSIGMKNLRLLNFISPPLPEQQKIAEILSTVDEKIEVIGEQIEQTQELKKGLMQRLLTKGIGHTQFKDSPLGEYPKTWDVEALDSYLKLITYGFTNPMPTTDEGIFMITAANVKDGKIDYAGCRKTSQEAFKSLLTDKSRPIKNDVLLTKDGTLGRVALVEDDVICINQSVALLRPNNRIQPQFLFYLLQSPYYQQTMLFQAGGSTIKHIYITIVNKMLIAVPSLAEQDNIVDVLSTVDIKLEVLLEKKEQYQELKKGLMQQLLTGKLRVNHLIEQPELA